MMNFSYPENVSEVIAARGQDDFMRFDAFSLDGQSDVDEIAVELQIAESLNDVRLVVVPFQAIMLVILFAHFATFAV